jgi:hypothetical protein
LGQDSATHPLQEHGVQAILAIDVEEAAYLPSLATEKAALRSYHPPKLGKLIQAHSAPALLRHQLRSWAKRLCHEEPFSVLRGSMKELPQPCEHFGI